MTEIYLHIVARMADYMYTHPYASDVETQALGLPCQAPYVGARYKLVIA